VRFQALPGILFYHARAELLNIRRTRNAQVRALGIRSLVCRRQNKDRGADDSQLDKTMFHIPSPSGWSNYSANQENIKGRSSRNSPTAAVDMNGHLFLPGYGIHGRSSVLGSWLINSTMRALQRRRQGRDKCAST
jgi:hypothetical protein